MTPDEAKSAVISLFKFIESAGYDVSLESDYGADHRVTIQPKQWNGWENVREVRWDDWYF